MRYLAIALLAISMAACTNDSTSPNGSVRGTYDLQTIDGIRLPVTFNDGSQIQSDQFIIRSDGTYEEDAVFTGSGVQIFDSGTYSVNNNAVTFFSDFSSGYSGSVSGNVLTITFPTNSGFGDTWVYNRE